MAGLTGPPFRHHHPTPANTIAGDLQGAPRPQADLDAGDTRRRAREGVTAPDAARVRGARPRGAPSACRCPASCLPEGPGLPLTVHGAAFRVAHPPPLGVAGPGTPHGPKPPFASVLETGGPARRCREGTGRRGGRLPPPSPRPSPLPWPWPGPGVPERSGRALRGVPEAPIYRGTPSPRPRARGGGGGGTRAAGSAVGCHRAP